MKVAIAHDFLNVLGGAERVLKALTEIYPEAPIYTLFINKRGVGDFLSDRKIITSSLQKKAELLGFRHKYLFPLMPRAVEEFDFKDFDVVISSQSAWMKGIITKPETVHISYCHTPTRFLWSDFASYVEGQGLGKLKQFFIRRIINKIRLWDFLAADRVDYFLANSALTQKRISKYYRQDSQVIYPPVEVDKFKESKEKKDFFLVVSRLSNYKKVDLAVKAFNELKLPLIVIGEGQQKEELKKIAKENVKILGYVNDEEMIRHYQEARAFVFPTFDEDFGLTPVEAMAAGTPIIAAGRGGTKETVVEGVTGEFFRKENAESLVKAVKRFIRNEKKYDHEKIRERAEKFSRGIFKQEIENLVNAAYKKGI